MNGTPGSLNELIENMTPEIYEQLKTAVALGHWDNGEQLTEEQKENCLQAVIAYDHIHFPVEHRTGYITGKKHCSDSGKN